MVRRDRREQAVGRSGTATIALTIVIVLIVGCGQGAAPLNGAANSTAREPTVATRPTDRGHESIESQRAVPAHDLSIDEAMGGHTLARHIGKSDEDLIERLHREPDISSASTYTDRATAEHVIGAALASPGAAFDKWRMRQGRRPNFVLHYNAHEAIGRSIRRGQTRSEPCERALVVLRWDDRKHQFYVLTSYPEEDR
jgi:hypothetical protein